MNYSPAFKWFIAVLLPLTIVWKLIAAPHASSNELKDKLVEFLVHHQFNVVVLEEWSDNMPIISASTGRCPMRLVRPSDSRGDAFFYWSPGIASSVRSVLTEGYLWMDVARLIIAGQIRGFGR